MQGSTQTCVIVILAYFPDSNQKPTENAVKTLKDHLSNTGFLQTKLFERHNVVKTS